MRPLRPFVPSRRAYMPRVWISVLLTVVAGLAVTFVVDGWWRTPLTVAASFVITGCQWWLWARRHPRRTAGGLSRQRREVARWN